MTTGVSGQGTITSAGVGSGLDVTSIVSKLMAVESQPLTQLQQKASSIQSQISTFGQLQSLMSGLQGSAVALKSLALWNQTTASSANPAAVTVSTTSGAGTSAQSGSYAVSVQSLASPQTVTAAALPSSTSTLGAGSLTITLGSYGSGSPASGFTPNASATPVTIAIGAGDSLQTIANNINAAGAGVSASIITDATGARLSIQSASTGAANAFQITATGAASPLAYDATAGSSPMTRTQTAANAQASVNGIAITSASNTLSNVVSGLTINLLQTTSAPVGVTVAPDTQSISNAISSFVNAFNAVAGFLHTQTQYDATSQTAGPLQGDSTALGLQSQLRAALNLQSSASSVFPTLDSMGISMQQDGTLAINSTQLNNALANLPEMRKAMTTSASTSSASGFIARYQLLADTALSFGGMLQSRTNGLNASLKLNADQQTSMQTRLSQVQATLNAQYTALDTQMAQLNSLSNYMTQQLAQFNKSG